MSDEIYSMTRSEKYARISTFLIDDIGSSGGIQKAVNLLAGIGSHGTEKAIGSAIKRAALSGETLASRKIRELYCIKDSDFKKYTQRKRHIISSNGNTEIDITFRGYHIPLLRFNTRIGADGRISARVKKSSAPKVFNHVFFASFGSHIGLFERTTKKRFPIEEKLGPSAPQMMEANDDFAQAIGDHVRDVFEKRIEHEVTAILNGWRK